MPTCDQQHLDQIELKLRVADLAVELLGQPKFRTKPECATEPTTGCP
jgi:hypothetical protein